MDNITLSQLINGIIPYIIVGLLLIGLFVVINIKNNNPGL